MNKLLTPSGLKNPYPILNEIREKNPVYEIEPNTWIISRYDDVCSGLQNTDLFTSTRKIELCTPSGINKECISNLFIASEDPPLYHDHRAAISSPFQMNKIRDLEAGINKIAEQSTHNILSKDKIEFFRDYSYPYVGLTINALFGIDNIQEHMETHRWIRALETATSPNLNPRTVQMIEVILFKQRKIFEQIINEKRANRTDDFLSDLVHGGEVNVTLTNKQLINALELLYRGGYQTTVHTLSIAVIYLSKNPLLCQRLKNTPTLMPAFVEEMLRLYSTVPMVIRHATDDVTLHGKTIRKGDLVWFSLASANRDPKYFVSPDTVNLTRNVIKSPISFGYGPHICLGRQLAKMEAEISLRHLLPVISSMTCPAEEDLKWYKTLVFRGLMKLPISISRA